MSNPNLDFSVTVTITNFQDQVRIFEYLSLYMLGIFKSETQNSSIAPLCMVAINTQQNSHSMSYLLGTVIGQ